MTFDTKRLIYYYALQLGRGKNTFFKNFHMFKCHLKLHYEELSDLYSLPKIVRVVESRRMRWVGHVARMGEGRGVHRVLVGKPE